MFDKNVYKMTVVCCNYAVASYLPCRSMLPPGNRRRAFHWEKYRRSAGDSCIANEPPENTQWNTPLVSQWTFAKAVYHDVSTSKEGKNHKPTCHVPKPITGMSNPLLSLISFFILLYNYLSSTTYPIDIRQQPNGIR